MHHLTLVGKPLMIGDEVADLLLRYAAAVAGANGGDHVALRACSADGQEVVVQVLLDSGTTLVTESSTSTLPEPDNHELVRYLRDRLQYFGLLPDTTGTMGLDGEG